MFYNTKEQIEKKNILISFSSEDMISIDYELTFATKRKHQIMVNLVEI